MNLGIKNYLINSKVFIGLIGLIIALVVGLASAEQNVKLIGAFVLICLFFLCNSRVLLGIYFISAQLLYVTPSLMNFQGAEVRISDIFFSLLLLKVGIPMLINLKLPKKIRVPILLFIVSCVISLLKASLISPSEVVLSQVITIARWMTSFVLILIIPKVLSTEKQILGFIKFIFTCLLIHSILSLMNFNDSQNIMRASNDFGNVADYAVVVVLLISLVYGRISGKIGNQFLNYILILFLIMSVFITFTRAAVIVLIISTLGFILKSKRLSQKISVIVGMAVVVPILIINYWDMFYNRFIADFAGITSTSRTSAGERMDVLLSGIKHISDDPLLGRGWSSFRFRPDAMYSEPHNNYLQIVLDNGVIGLVVFVVLLGSIYKILKFNYKNADSSMLKSGCFGLYLWFSGMIPWLFFNQILPSTLTTFYFWAVAGLGLAINIYLSNQMKLKQEDQLYKLSA